MFARLHAPPDPAIVAAALPPFKRADPARGPLVRRRQNVQDWRQAADAVGDTGPSLRMSSTFPIAAIVPRPHCR
jgi:hypothetical protein